MGRQAAFFSGLADLLHDGGVSLNLFGYVVEELGADHQVAVLPVRPLKDGSLVEAIAKYLL